MRSLLSIRLLATAMVAISTLSFSQDPGAPRTPGKPGGEKFFDKKEKEPDTTRSLQGKVFDPSEAAVVGAVVQLKDTKTLRIRSFITLDDGGYFFHGLSTETDYEIRASHDGRESKTRRLTVYDSRKSATIDLKLEPKG